MALIEHFPFHADPILAAIDRHNEAWSVFQVAPAGKATERANDAMDAALDELLSTPCATRFGALALLRHLRWYIAEESVTYSAASIVDRLVITREADLTLFLGYELPTSVIPVAMPLGRLAAGIVRRLPHAGEMLAALIIIGGGMAATGFASIV